MTPKQVQIEFESVTFMYEKIDNYNPLSEKPKRHDRNYRGN